MRETSRIPLHTESVVYNTFVMLQAITCLNSNSKLVLVQKYVFSIIDRTFHFD